MHRLIRRGSQVFELRDARNQFARAHGCTGFTATESEPAEAPPLDRAAPEVVQTTWVQVELVDMDNQPIAGEKFRVVTPDGRTHEGRTDANGLAQINGISREGDCEIRFPDLDEEAWQAA